jgi:hypothetical protein
MRKTSVCILTLALMVGTAALSLAADAKAPASKDQAGATTTSSGSATTSTTTTTETKPAKPAKTHKAACKASHGTVASKDDAAKSFVVHPKTGADDTYMTNDKTSYWHGKKKATWADLAVGDNVHVTCWMDGTNMVAKTVKMAAPKK